MNDSNRKSGISRENNKQADWNLETIAEQIFNKLGGSFTRTTIQAVLEEVAYEYSRARVQTFLPIFIRRDTEKRLLAMQETSATADLGMEKARAPSES